MNTTPAARRRPLRTLSALSALSVAGLALWTGSAPAVADTGSAANDACGFTGTLCLFEGGQYTGERFTVQSMNPAQAVCVDLVSHGWGERAHSAANTNSRTAVLYSGADCTGTPYAISGNVPSFDFPARSVRVH